ncbi:peptidoglycan editing factor PgeF [Thiobacter aerophilum]|uniref:Purine nucleoside phosphorylase n=1 Tax=Thiobacter aerophilum TaxID=3121275 RepID=A0ABV0EC48_9BURK
MTLAAILPDWPTPPHVRALVTTRAGGVSVGPYASLNLAAHVGDDPAAVAENRARLRRLLPAEPLWLEQVHGTAVWRMEAGAPGRADASVSRTAGQVCAVLTADCLPVLFADRAGTVVAAAHAGWRGLCAGVLERTVAAMQTDPGQIMSWLGPAIGPEAFQVGEEVRLAFLAVDAAAAEAFRADGPGRWRADLYALARMRLARAGVQAVFGGGLCTFSDPTRFFSYRRDGATGRMASLIWLDPGL